jgi:hypothetical protein
VHGNAGTPDRGTVFPSFWILTLTPFPYRSLPLAPLATCLSLKGYANNLANCRPVADFLWWSQYPRVAWLEHPQNPISGVYSEDDSLFQVFSGRK